MRRLWPLNRSAVSARSSGVEHRIVQTVDLPSNIDPDDVGVFLCEPHGMAATLAVRRTGGHSLRTLSPNDVCASTYGRIVGVRSY